MRWIFTLLFVLYFVHEHSAVAQQYGTPEYVKRDLSDCLKAVEDGLILHQSILMDNEYIRVIRNGKLYIYHFRSREQNRLSRNKRGGIKIYYWS